VSETDPLADPLTRAEKQDLYGQDDPFFGGKVYVCAVCGMEVKKVNEEGACASCVEWMAGEG
jgi:rubrerythrin